MRSFDLNNPLNKSKFEKNVLYDSPFFNPNNEKNKENNHKILINLEQ